MAEKTRTEHSIRNASVSLIASITTILAGYLTRIVFSHMLSADYLGVNGLFLDIMSLLSLTEMGFGAAITFALYKPIAQNDIEQQKSLMRLYRTFYRIVAGGVAAIGLLLLPFLNMLIRDNPEVEHITLIYLMYLLNSVLSYLLIYKKTLIDAHQRMHVGVLVHTGTLLAQYALQCAVLLLTRNYILYLAIYLFCTVANNVVIGYIANRDYPFLKEKNVLPLSKESKKGIYRNIRSMVMHKMGSVMVNSTDNLLISTLVGTLSVAKYSNYYLLIGSVQQVLRQVFTGIAASVGNLGAESTDKDEISKVLFQAFFIGQGLYNWATITLYELLSPFVSLSFGEQYVFTNAVVLILCINFYVAGLRQATLVFHDSLGLFWYDRYKAIIEAVINLTVSIVLGRIYGVGGIFAGTLISALATTVWVEPLVVFKVSLKRSPWPFYLRYAIGCVLLAITWFLTDLLCRNVQGSLWMILLIRGMICLAVPNALFILAHLRSSQLHETWGIGRSLIKRILHRK